MTLKVLSSEAVEKHREAIVRALADRLVKSGQVTPEQSISAANERLSQLLEVRENYFFTADDELVWLMSQQPRQISIMLPADGKLSETLLAEIEAWAAGNDVQTLRISLSDVGELERLQARGYVASNLVMEKRVDAAPESTLSLVPMTPVRFDAYLEKLIVEYGKEKLKAGNFSQETWLEESRREIMQILPDGLHTANHHFFTLCNEDDQDVGILWIGRRNLSQGEGYWIFDIEVDDKHRRKGYGTQALLALEALVMRESLASIGLHVFGHNHGARALYEKLGYQLRTVVLSKPLAGDNA